MRRIESVRIGEEGIYRFRVASADGKIEALSNPVWVRENPPYRLYWGETHTHTGMAEGQGSIGRSYRFAREDASLDFLGLSEHDIWLDDFEWEAMRRAAEVNTVPEKFVAFLGYEWTSRRQWGGHHNVFFRSPDSVRVGVQTAPTLTGLYEGLRAKYGTKDVLIIPHAHQAGDWRTTTLRWKRWSRSCRCTARSNGSAITTCAKGTRLGFSRHRTIIGPGRVTAGHRAASRAPP